jgi:TRAP-type C4-dicarboxylate transport system substrate-binding protein
MILVIALVGAIFFHAPSYAKEKAKVTLKLATLQPKGSTLINILEELGSEIREKTNNEVGFKIYAGGVQGDEEDALRKMRIGQLHGGAFMGHGLGQIVPEIRVSEIPYVFRNHDEVSFVRGQLEEAMNRYFEDRGYIIIGWGEVGFVYNFSNVPITSIEILKQQKVWVWNDDPLITAIYRTFGITPISLSLNDLMTSLSSNIVDTAGITPFGAVAFRWHTRFKYMSDYPVMNITAALIVTKEIWDKISPESQKKIKQIAKGYSPRIIQANREANRKSIETLKKAGITIIRTETTEMDMQYLMEAGKKARESLIGKLYSRQLLEHTLSLVDKYRKDHPNSAIRILK